MSEDAFIIRIRSVERILYDILVLCKKPQRKTWVMEKTNLNMGNTQRFLDRLLESSLITGVSLSRSRFVYQTTIEGLEYIKTYKKLAELIEK